MELALKRIGYSYGRPAVVATHVGETFDRPIHAAVSRFASGQLRFEYAGRPYDAAMMPADLTLQGSTHVSLTPSEPGDCVPRLARIDASGAEGTLTCRRAAIASDLVPTALDFSARA